MKKRILSLITALALCLSLCPVGALAAEGRTGGTGAPSTDPTDHLAVDNFDKVTDISFTSEYYNKFENLVYGSTSGITAPDLPDLVFWVNDKPYMAPESTNQEFKAKVTTVNWGPNVSGDALPRVKGEYALTVSVTLTKITPATSPDPSNPSDPGTPEREETKIVSSSQPRSFSIAPKPITPSITGTFTKQYDGSTAYTPPTGATPISLAGKAGNDVVTATASYKFSNASVGKKYNLIVDHITLEGTAKENYELTETSLVAKEVAEVTPAKMDDGRPTNKIVLRNRRENTYSFDLSKLLPRLPEGMLYNDTNDITEIKYELLEEKTQIGQPAFFEMKDGKPVKDVIKIEDRKLYVKTKYAALDNPVDNVGTIVVQVESQNFEPFECSITMSSANKTQVHITGLTPVNPDYNGEEQKGFLEPLDFAFADTSESEGKPDLTPSDVRFSYQSSSRSPVKYGPSEVPPKQPGNYEVTVTIDENNPDYVASEFFVFNINKAKIKVIAKDRTIRIDDPVPEFSKPQLGVDYDVVGVAEGDELRLPPTMKYATVADSIMEGEFDILIDGAMVPDNDHYDPAIEYVPGKLKVTSMTAEQENPFSDVSEYTWYVTAVKYVYNKGMMNGVSATLFDPMGDLTRGMLVTILYRMDGERPVWATMPFTDLDPNGYYLNAVRWASSNQIVNGYGDGRFGPNDPLTREQMAIILYNYTRYKGITPNKAASLDHFVDALDTSATGYRALQWACAEKLIQGTGSTTLSPHDKALRAQVAVVLMRYGTLYPNLVPKDKTDTSSTT